MSTIDPTNLFTSTLYNTENTLKFKDYKSMTFVIYCHHGIRSLHATHQMRSKGFKNTYSLAGGIERWSYDIDPTIARY